MDGSRLVTNASSNVDSPKFVVLHVADMRVQRPSYDEGVFVAVSCSC